MCSARSAPNALVDGGLRHYNKAAYYGGNRHTRRRLLSLDWQFGTTVSQQQKKHTRLQFDFFIPAAAMEDALPKSGLFDMRLLLLTRRFVQGGSSQYSSKRSANTSVWIALRTTRTQFIGPSSKYGCAGMRVSRIVPRNIITHRCCTYYDLLRLFNRP